MDSIDSARSAANELIVLTRRGAVAEVTMHSPPVNSISEPWLKAFNEVLSEIESCSDFSVLHLRSSLKVFAAGGDLVEMKARMASEDPAANMYDRLARIQALFSRIERLPLVVFCEIGGDALGGGLELALACDLRMAASPVRLGCPEIRLGLFPAAGGSQRLTRLCGPSVAARMIYTGDHVSGETAQHIGLVHWCVPAEALQQTAIDTVNQIASYAPEALSAAKQCIAAQGNPAADGAALERTLGSRLIVSPRTKELVHAFFAKHQKR